MKRERQIRARRRFVVGVGLATLVVASATACIFDQSDYQGGGRIDKGGQVTTAEPDAPSSAPTATATSNDDGSLPNPFLDDAGDAGDG